MNKESPDDLPRPTVKAKRARLSLVWFVPLVALALGGWLVFANWATQGPLVHISFENGAGLEAGVTPIKYKDVSIGLVESVEIDTDFDRVLVSARLDKKVIPYLNTSTQFWIERPRVGTAGISGLGTLFAGVHIGFEAVREGQELTEFIGSDKPPLVNTGSDGTRVILNAESVGSLVAGGPLYYKSFKVGTIESVKLNEGFDSVVLEAFIDAPYDQLVHADSRFWNVSGVSAEINADGVSVKFKSMESLLIGGIEFDSPSLGRQPELAANNSVYQLHQSFADVGVEGFNHQLYYVVNFSQSVRGLSVDAPVEYRGLKIGRVVSIGSRYNENSGEILIPIVIEIEPERLGLSIDGDGKSESVYQEIVDLGLTAKLEIANLLTGQLFVSLDFYEKEERVVLADFDGYKQLPTISTDLNRIAANVGETLEKVNRLELEALVNNLNETISGIRVTVSDAGNLMGDANNSISKITAALEQTLSSSRELLVSGKVMFDRGQTVMQSLDEDSATRYELDQTLKELKAAARSLKALTETIEKTPNSIIFGKQNKN